MLSLCVSSQAITTGVEVGVIMLAAVGVIMLAAVACLIAVTAAGLVAGIRLLPLGRPVILAELNLSNRCEIAAWALRQVPAR